MDGNHSGGALEREENYSKGVYGGISLGIAVRFTVFTFDVNWCFSKGTRHSEGLFVKDT